MIAMRILSETQRFIGHPTGTVLFLYVIYIKIKSITQFLSMSPIQNHKNGNNDNNNRYYKLQIIMQNTFLRSP